MSLDEKANVSENVRRIVENASCATHPFKRRSAYLEDLISIFNEMRALPKEDFMRCVDALIEIVEGDRECFGCYGKGLAFVMRLTEGVDEDAHLKARERYKAFATAREDFRNFDEDLGEIMAEYGVG